MVFYYFLINDFLLLKDVNAKDSKKITPLHCSSMRGNFKILEILLKEGGDATAVTGNNN